MKYTGQTGVFAITPVLRIAKASKIRDEHKYVYNTKYKNGQNFILKAQEVRLVRVSSTLETFIAKIFGPAKKMALLLAGSQALNLG